MYINNESVCIYSAYIEYPHEWYLTVLKRKKKSQVTNHVKGFEKFFDRNVIKYIFLSNIPIFK